METLKEQLKPGQEQYNRGINSFGRECVKYYYCSFTGVIFTCEKRVGCKSFGSAVGQCRREKTKWLKKNGLDSSLSPDENIQALITELQDKTQDLKELYIEKSIEYANNEFDNLIEKINWKYEDWVKEYPVNNGIKGLTLSKEGYKIRNKMYSLYKIGKEKYFDKVRKDANTHYTNSICKLANRLNDKGIGTNFEIISSRLNVNFEMTITDKDTGKSVRAWTIVAQGIVQKPHFRYLVH